MTLPLPQLTALIAFTLPTLQWVSKTVLEFYHRSLEASFLSFAVLVLVSAYLLNFATHLL